MPNPYFRFKQFTIQQDRSAMKVCTDSCILGAWTAIRLSGTKRILDIGTGTGLLALMVAQKSDAEVDAIETDADTCIQAGENIRQSPWSERVRIHEGDVRRFAFPSRYDHVITNPPFFESDLLSPERKRNIAKHHNALTLDELIRVMDSCLCPEGTFSILLPYHRDVYFEKLAGKNGFFIQEKLIIRQTPAHEPFRTVGLYGHHSSATAIPDGLTIKDSTGKYSPEFAALLQDYYE